MSAPGHDTFRLSRAAWTLKTFFVGMERVRATFTPGYNTAQRNPNPQGTANVRDFHIYPAFHACDGGDYSDCHMNNDFAVLVLDRPYQNWMRYGHQETITAATMINTAGYPGGLISPSLGHH